MHDMNNWLTLSRDQIRELDRRAIEEFGIPGILLMESAGRGIAEFLLSLPIQDEVMICCGKGNNAGDGFVVARYLNNWNIPAHILLFAHPEELKGDAKINYEIAVKTALPITQVNDKNFDAVVTDKLSHANWIVDAMVGTGLRDRIHSFYLRVIQVINESSAKIVAVDIPSGLDCDTGQPLGIAIEADYTLSIAGYKKGFANPEAKKFLGEIQVIDIGLQKILILKSLGN